MKKTKIGALLLTGIMLLSLAACGQKAAEPATSGDTTKEAGGETTEAAGGDLSGDLRVTWWGNTQRDQLYQQINEMFMAEHPGVNIITESPGWNDYWPAVATSFASGSAPDVIQFQSGRVGEFVPMGVLAPLDEYVDNGTINLEGWNKDLANTGIFDNNLYMVTLGITAQTCYINQTYLDELGIELWAEDEDITWDEFTKFMKEVQDKLPAGSHALQEIAKNNDLIWLWMRQHTPAGVEWTDAEGNFAPTEEALTKWFDLADKMRQEESLPSVALGQEWEQLSWEEGAFVNRNVVFYFANANQIMTYQNATEDKIVMRKVPTAPDADNAHGDLLISSAFAVSEASKQKELAATYIDFFANNIEAQKVFNFELGVPGSLAVQEALVANADPANIMANDYVNMVSETALPFVPMQPGVAAVVDEIIKVGQEVGAGSRDTTSAAQTVLSTANDLIRTNR